MTDRTPLVFNLVDKRIEQVQSSDTLYVPNDLTVYSGIRSATIDDSNALNTGFFARTNFMTAGILGNCFTTSATNSGSIAITTVDPSSNNGCMNYLALSTGSNSNGKPCVIGNNLYLNSSFAEYEFCARVSFNSLSASNQDYAIQLGLMSTDETAISFSGNLIAFYYDENTIYGGNWTTAAYSNSSGIIGETSVAVTTGWQKLNFKLDRNSNAPRVRFYINNSLVSTHTINVPDSTSNTHLKFMINKESGTTARELRIDYAYLKITYLNRQSRF